MILIQKKIISELENISKQVHSKLLSIIDDSLINDKKLRNKVKYSTYSKELRLRPYFCLKGAELGSIKKSDAILFAVAIELLQLSTLVIDDILDESLKRNNKASCYKKFGIKESILLGEYLRSLSYNTLLTLDNKFSRKKILDSIKFLEEAYHAITIGQYYDIQSQIPSLLNEFTYFKLIELTTGIFIKNSLLIGASLSEIPIREFNKLKIYGHYIGLAYQLRDDIIDFIGEESYTGKESMLDIKNNRFRLPMIYLYTKAKKKYIDAFNIIQKKKYETEFGNYKIVSILRECGAIKYSMDTTKNLCYEAEKNILNFYDTQTSKELIELSCIISNFES